VSQVALANATALQAVTVATAAEATAKGVQKLMFNAKYASSNLIERKKRMAISPLEIGSQQQGLIEAARSVLVGVLASGTGEPQPHWEPHDIEVIPMKGKQQGKYIVLFKVQTKEDADLIMRKKQQLKQRHTELFVRVWLDKEEADNKQKVMSHLAFKEAQAIVLGKPKHTAGYKMGWDLDRAFTIINGQKTYWHADDLQQSAAQEGAAGGAAGGDGAMEQ